VEPGECDIIDGTDDYEDMEIIEEDFTIDLES
jgi:hypothetical protein